jgi:Holliday junction resolvasome RuvABC ATP-dependent DNA helicase subunit
MKEDDQRIESFNPRESESVADKELEGIVRPGDFQNFSGQDKVVENLKGFCTGCKIKGRIFGSCFIIWSSGAW